MAMEKNNHILSVYSFLARRAWSVIVLCALFCNLAAKFFFSYRVGLVGEYYKWIVSDVVVLVAIEVVLSAICFRWPKRWVIRVVTIFAAVVCAWSVINASWLIRMGVQILPRALLPLIRDPLNSLIIIGVNLVKMPVAAVVLLGPSAVALAFLFSVLIKPQKLQCRRERFMKGVLVRLLIVLAAVLSYNALSGQSVSDVISSGLSYNCQLKAVTSSFLPNPARLAKADLVKAKRKIPGFDQIKIGPASKLRPVHYNVVVVVLEGIQYHQTSLSNEEEDLTPYLKKLAREGVTFTNNLSVLTHTTKALFSLLTGRYPSPTHDLAEAVPVEKPYATIATILKNELNYRTAFFQSAKGNFECRPGLVHNLGFDKFWTREYLGDTNAFVGYLACDELSMIDPIAKWVKSDDRPFFLTVLCSVSHDPYEVPQWYATVDKEPLERYRQTISYTDKFIEKLDDELGELDLSDDTIFCVVGDHGEGFGEHGLFGHERIAFEEVLSVPWVMRGRLSIEPFTVVNEPVSSIDLVPTLLGLVGFDVEGTGFDGLDALGTIMPERQVYFTGWMQESPAGFVKGNHKYIYYPTSKNLAVYDLAEDPAESIRIDLKDYEEQEIVKEIIMWRKNNIFQIEQKQRGEKEVFNLWQCRWNNRVSSAKYKGSSVLRSLSKSSR